MTVFLDFSKQKSNFNYFSSTFTLWIWSFHTSGTNLLNQMVFVARTSSTPTPNFMLVMFILDSLSQGLHVAVGFVLHPLACTILMLEPK